MVKFTYRGSVRSLDEIPQPISILMGRNLRKSSDEPSKPPKKEPPKSGRRAERSPKK